MSPLPPSPPPPTSTPLKVFDEIHPPSIDLIGECVHCGFCLASCPTYQLWGEEADSPRGRIYLMKLGLAGEVALDAAYVGHFDRCLGCMACLTSCPSGVHYDKLIEATRSQIQRRFDRSLSDRLFRRMIFSLFPYPARLRLLSIPLLIYQLSGLRTVLQLCGLLAHLPPRLAGMENLMPPVTVKGLFSRLANRSPAGTKRLRVGMLQGCVARVFFDEVNQATARVLAAEGCQVIVPPRQGCCGALALHAGEESMAMTFARRMIDAFASADVDVIAVNAAGCGSAMKEYAHLLRDDPQYAERARAFVSKCRDVSEILTELAPVAPRHPVSVRVAYHDACHLQHAQGITQQPRQLLRAIPGVELLEIQDAGTCCGSAGIYNLTEPEAARELGRRKAAAIMRTAPQAIVSGNPGCALQISSSLKSAGHPLPVLHWIQLLDASIAHRTPAALQRRQDDSTAKCAIAHGGRG